MSNNEQTNDLTGKVLNFEELQKDLNNTSPLQMSKKLIEVELFDQQSSIEVINKIYEEFENKDNVVDSLVNPMLLSLADGLIKHPKLNGTFRKTNITPSRLVKEVNQFTYIQDVSKDIDEDVFLNQAEKTYYNNEKLGVNKEGKEYNKYFHRNKHYDIKSRQETMAEKGLNNDDIVGKDMDHVNPVNHLREKYQNNPYLYREDIAKLIGMSENEEYIDSSLNRSKGDSTWSEYLKKLKDNPTDDSSVFIDGKGNVVHKDGRVLLSKKEQEEKLKLEKETTIAQNKKAAILMAKNIGLKGLGDIIVLILKPIWFEIKDMFRNGILNGFDTKDKIEAFIFRLKRVSKFIKDNVLSTLDNSLKDIFANFIPTLINSLANIFTGIFKKIIKIISDGFMAIKEAFKVMMKPDSEVSPAQKADAITKIIASAIVPILVFSLEESIFSALKFLDDTPLGFLKDVATIILSGLASTLVVWLLDQIDLFSMKEEKRLARIKEIFQIRVENIKQNTDMFEKESLEVLAKQKLNFTKIVENMNESINHKTNPNTSIYDMADFMKIDLNVKSTDDFLHLLNTNEKLAI